MSEAKRIFIGGVGYTNLRDLSVGPIVLPQLQQLDWPAGVEIDDQASLFRHLTITRTES